MKIEKKKLIIYAAVAVVVLLVLIVAAEGLTSLSKKKTDVSKGIMILEQAASADVKNIENKITKIEEANQASQSTDRNYKAIFSDTVVMGDSITEALTEFDLLNPSSVVAKIGVELDELEEEIARVEKINPQVVFLAYGMNDIIATAGDTELFTEQYNKVLETIQEKLPNTKIFVNSIFPVQDQETENEPAFAKVEQYNEALHDLCDKKQIAFIDNTSLVSDRFYEEDGIHFKSSFYPYWLNRMAEVASL